MVPVLRPRPGGSPRLRNHLSAADQKLDAHNRAEAVRIAQEKGWLEPSGRRDVAAATSVLASLGTVRHVGRLGRAARLKLVANSMLADVLLAAAELQVAGEEAGLSADDVFWVLQRLAPSLEVRRGGYLEHRHKPALFALRDLHKDLGFASELFRQSSADTPLTDVSRSLVADAAWETPDLDVSAVIRPYRDVVSHRWNGTEPKAEVSKGVA